jgi:hypothetical protein
MYGVPERGKKMNGVTEERYQLRLTQTAKGVFYVDKLGVTEETWQKTIEEVEKFAVATTVLLDKLNKGEIDRSQIKEQ